MADEPSVVCELCGRGIAEHGIFHIFHDESPADHGLTEAVFDGVDTSGFYCLPAEVVERLRET